LRRVRKRAEAELLAGLACRSRPFGKFLAPDDEAICLNMAVIFADSGAALETETCVAYYLTANLHGFAA